MVTGLGSAEAQKGLCAEAQGPQGRTRSGSSKNSVHFGLRALSSDLLEAVALRPMFTYISSAVPLMLSCHSPPPPPPPPPTTNTHIR